MSKEYEAIKVWRFYKAPENLRALSRHGGDEDWLAVIPPEYSDEWISWAESGGPFGCSEVDECDHPDLLGYKVRIGAHS